MDLLDFIDLIKTITCFNMVDLLQTSQNYYLKIQMNFKLDLVIPLLKTSFQKSELKRLIYRGYTSNSKDSFLTDLSNSTEV